jgi:serine/threonine protein kinase
MQPLALIGKGAFGEVRLVRMRERFSKEIYAMKSMLKEAMINKNQVGHVRAERDILTESENPWIVMLYYTFQVAYDLLFMMHMYMSIFGLNEIFTYRRMNAICTW